jgi:cytochrome c oxidase subunit 2
MNANRLFVRYLLGVTTAIAAITTLALLCIPRASQPGDTVLDEGAQLFDSKGCSACHTINGNPRVGPTFFHDYGSRIALADGTTITMDDAYIRESILAPQAKARPGYPPAMPSYTGQITDREITALTAYLRSLR